MLLLSCFGHFRAKNNSVLSGGLELCSSFVWDYPWLSLPSSQGCEGFVLLCVSSGWSSNCAGLANVEGPVNLAVLVWMIVSLGYV